MGGTVLPKMQPDRAGRESGSRSRPGRHRVIFQPMTTPADSATITSRWGSDTPAPADPLDGLVHLSNLLGRETRLVQPGGGNTSIKLSCRMRTAARSTRCW